ncbi:MAG: hypothetical protein E7I50_08275, partial [Klebsiella oxytoca]|nr:hypothetical protein [Klebsiella oxytoca]
HPLQFDGNHFVEYIRLKPDGSRCTRTGHGPQMLVKKKTNPSSSVIGRLRDQSEIRGVEVALKRRSFLQD